MCAKGCFWEFRKCGRTRSLESGEPVWRDNKSEYLPVILTLIIQKFVGFVFRLLSKYRVFSQGRVSIAMAK